MQPSSACQHTLHSHIKCQWQQSHAVFWCSVKSFWDFMDKSEVVVRGQGRHKHWTEYDFTDFSTKQKQNVQCWPICIAHVSSQLPSPIAIDLKTTAFFTGDAHKTIITSSLLMKAIKGILLTSIRSRWALHRWTYEHHTQPWHAPTVEQHYPFQDSHALH